MNSAGLWSSQDGAVGRYTLPPHTTKSRTTTNLKTKNYQNCQKIKLHGSLTTKELKKKHSFRPVGRAETGSQVERMCGKVEDQGRQGWWLAVPHSCVDKLKGTTGERDRLYNSGFQRGEIKPRNLWL